MLKLRLRLRNRKRKPKKAINIGELMEDIKHNWFMDLRHMLFAHQNLWGNWLDTTFYDGCSFHARCRYCGKEGMLDSQGNLF